MTANQTMIHASGDMADRVRAFPWEGTPLGAIRGWSQELLCAVNLLLFSPAPTFLYWGPNLIGLYNDAFAPFLEGKHPESLGQPAKTIWKEIWHIIGAQFQGVLDTGRVVDNRRSPLSISRNGVLEAMYWDYTAVPIHDAQGQVAGVYTASQEITALVQAERKLQASEAESRRILESIGDAVIVTDSTGAVVRMNPVAEQLTQWSLSQAKGSSLAEVFRILNEDSREVVENPADKVRRYGATVGLANHTILIGKAGREIYIDDSAAPIRNDAGELTGVVLVFRNIQERREAELKRELLAEQLAEVQEATTDAILTINRSWTITYLNGPAKKASGSISEGVGKNFWEQYPDAVYPNSPYVEHYERAMNEGVGADFEAYYPEPLEIWVHIRVRPTRDGIVLFFQNITETKRAQAALIQAEKLAAVGRLSASIAHEINNPLESVTNLLYLARRSESHSEIQDYLDTAERELRRVSLISSQTLRFYKQSTNPVETTCTDLFSSVLDMYQGRLVNSRVQVEKRKRAHRSVRCFDGEIRQILNNFIGNAIDAMHPAGGRLLLRSRDGHNWRTGEAGLVLTVADTGHGMAPATLKKIFEAFYTTKGIGGTGLGLWVSQEIVTRHHGKLRVRSSQNESHRGTVFTLFLPFEAATRSNQEGPAETEQAKPARPYLS